MKYLYTVVATDNNDMPQLLGVYDNILEADLKAKDTWAYFNVRIFMCELNNECNTKFIQ